METYQTERLRRKLCLLKEGHGDLAGNNAQVGGIGDLEELVEDAFLLGGEAEVWLSCPCGCVLAMRSKVPVPVLLSYP